MANKELRIQNARISLNGDELLRINKRVAPGEVLTVMGPSGSGKSTLLAFLAGFLPTAFHASGRVWIGDSDVTELAAEKRRMGLLFQDPLLFPHMSIADNLRFGLAREQKNKQQIIKSSLEDMGLAGFENRDPATLSGGQKSRVALLRTLLSKPHAVLLDEPFSRLDAGLRRELRGQVFDQLHAAQLPVVLVTHDRADAKAAGGEIVSL